MKPVTTKITSIKIKWVQLNEGTLGTMMPCSVNQAIKKHWQSTNNSNDKNKPTPPKIAENNNKHGYPSTAKSNRPAPVESFEGVKTDWIEQI